MAKRKTIIAYAAFYGVLILVLCGFLVLKFGYFIGNVAPGQQRVFQASVFVNKLSEENTVYFAVSQKAPIKWRKAADADPLKIEVVNIQSFGFFIEYARQPRCTFDYKVDAAEGARPGRYIFKIIFDSGYEYVDNVIVRRKLF